MERHVVSIVGPAINRSLVDAELQDVMARALQARQAADEDDDSP